MHGVHGSTLPKFQAQSDPRHLSALGGYTHAKQEKVRKKRVCNRVGEGILLPRHLRWRRRHGFCTACHGACSVAQSS